MRYPAAVERVRSRPDPTRRPGFARDALAKVGAGGVAVAVAGFAVNGLAYLVLVLGARQLSAGDLGALATAMAIAATAAVAGLGLQTALAVRWARDGRVDNAGRVTVVTAAAATGVLTVAAPALAAILDLPIAVPLLIAAATAAVVVASRYLGHFQGTERYGWLAVGLLLLAVGRFGGVIVALWAGSGLTGALATGAAIAWLAAGVLVLADRIPRSAPVSVGEPVLVRARQVLAAGGATLAMLVIASTDLVLARAVLGAEESGAYAVGSVLTKGALWAPQVVTVLVLPRLARGRTGALTLAIALVAASGVALSAAAAFAGRFAMGLAGGAHYQHLGGYAVGFAAVGALYAVVFVLVNAEIAAGDRWPALGLWFAAAGLAVAVFLLPRPTVPAILTASIVTATAATGLTALIAARRHRAARRGRPPDERTVPLLTPPA